MKVYVIRHGESETNLSKKWTGWMNVPLTDKGKEDAKRAGAFLEHMSFDKIWTSDLCRAIETAEIAIPNADYETSELLREINVGTLAGEPLSILTGEQKAYVSKYGYAEFGGETVEQLYDRVEQMMKKLETLECDTVALFCHAGWLRTMFYKVIGTRVPKENLCCNNCAIGIFEYTERHWQLHSWINLT